MSENETPPEGKGSGKKTDHRTVVVVIGFFLALILLVGLNMN